MGQALYRKYRSKSFDDVVGQNHITDTLKKAIKSGRVSHAYLFTGPRGVGKTSVARILAHEVNGLAYKDDSIHLDIIEIDAASNRRIDEIRELRDKVHISPTSAKYKVYIIDEVHMLTREAFNALLKTLEEPPAHCIFILATTEGHKLPETIVSRTQRFEFKPIAKTHATEHLSQIAKSEKISIDSDALEMLALHGDGSFRDSISLLDQLSSSGSKLTAENVRDFLGLPTKEVMDQLVAAVEGGQLSGGLALLEELQNQGTDAALSAKILADKLRQKIIEEPSATWAAELLKELIEVPASSRPAERLEIAILEACSKRQTSEPEPAPTASVITSVSVSEPVQEEPKPAKASAPKRQSKVSMDEQSWEEVLNKVKAEAASLYTALRLATPELGKDRLTLVFQFPLHQKKVNLAKHKELIGNAVAQVTGQNVNIEATVEKAKPVPPKPATPQKDSDDLQSISNIFGQAEVLDS